MSSDQGFGQPWHLVSRFFGSLLPVGPPKSSEGWANGHLLPGEAELFGSMSGQDRRHAIAVARRAVRLLAEPSGTPAEPTRGFVAAALLHDVGKTQARLGTFGRVAATMAAVALRRDTVVSWADHPPHAKADGPSAAATRWSISDFRRRMGRYLMHDTIGANLLEEAGSDSLTIRWAREHHLPESRWSVERRLGRALKEADGD